jgi:hypothetical protein
MQIPSQKKLLEEGKYSLEEAELQISGYNCEQSEIITNERFNAPTVEDKEIIFPTIKPTKTTMSCQRTQAADKVAKEEDYNKKLTESSSKSIKKLSRKCMEGSPSNTTLRSRGNENILQTAIQETPQVLLASKVVSHLPPLHTCIPLTHQTVK